MVANGSFVDSLLVSSIKQCLLAMYQTWHVFKHVTDMAPLCFDTALLWIRAKIVVVLPDQQVTEQCLEAPLQLVFFFYGQSFKVTGQPIGVNLVKATLF